ncbi:MAG: MotA/TolQ/ExbB proton channel family protein [Candidatus Eisenbacteria bacterium]|nr:MotA/TolQ/ExbB proton channel family protein [Candidatus Eisenbacteria bacterium]
MRRLSVTRSPILAILVTAVTLFAVAAPAQDVREAARRAEADRQEALDRAREAEQQILSDRTALAAAVEELEAEDHALDARLNELELEVERLEARRVQLADRWARQELEYKEISGNVRLAARDLTALLEQSPTTALRPERLERVQSVLREGYFPDIDDISGMAAALLDEMELSGQVGLRDARFVGRDGAEQTGQLLTLGAFTAIYRTEDGREIGFLRYSQSERKLFALSALPSSGMAGRLRRYMDGRSESVTIDISGGAALRQITQEVGLWEHLMLGGPIVYPILALGAIALIMVAYKLIFLNRVHGNTDRIMSEVSSLASKGDWDGCDAIVRKYKDKKMPVVEVVADGLSARDEDRATLESVMQEAILREMPRVERGLSMLAVFGAVAPLLGLLGTVTGMIETFRVITLYGTGDPRLMSSGISEALITTELGLTVAIPIMLLHTFLSRRADAIIAEMEEKAVHLSNIILKEKIHGSNGRTRKAPRGATSSVSVSELAEGTAD